MRFYEILADFMNFMRCGRPEFDLPNSNGIGDIFFVTKTYSSRESDLYQLFRSPSLGNWKLSLKLIKSLSSESVYLSNASRLIIDN